jgi:hypothetical protein
VAALGFLNGNRRLYSARPILISGTCKTEDGQKHAELLQLLIRAINMKLASIAAESGSLPSKVVSIASDGETRRGRALAQLTMHSQLPPSSKIYELLSPLRFMNLLVGEDNITADKDFKHIFKRIRSREIRASGITIFNEILTPSAIQLHLRDAGHTKQHVEATFRPDDKQDVPLAFSALQDIVTLPPAPETKPPGYRSTRDALIILGQVFKYLLHPYICVELSLSEQLEYLSAAAHLILLLYRTNKQLFFPNLLYADIMIMIKNVYFSVAKAKVDNPEGQFFLVLLGTDRLETLFGIIRSMIGNDCGADVLQLSERITGTTQVAEILAQHPQWDSSPRRLNMPAIDREGNIITLSNHSDHIGASSWQADLSLLPVNPQTSWNRGFRLLEENPMLRSIHPQISGLQSIDHHSVDILCPLGTLLVNPDGTGGDDEEEEDIEACHHRPVIADRMEGLGCSQEVEDEVVAEEESGNEALSRKFLPYIKLPSGEKVNKGKLLARLLQHKKTTTSADRLKRYQNVSRFSSLSDMGASNDLDTAFSVSDLGQTLMIGDPIVSLLQCEGVPFLCVGEILDLTIDSEPVKQLPLTTLTDIRVSVTYKLVSLSPATTADDPKGENDWRSHHSSSVGMNPFKASVPGRLIQSINPAIIAPEPVESGMVREWPFYLLDSQSLVALTASFLNILGSEDGKLIPSIPQSKYYPYIKSGTKLSLHVHLVSNPSLRPRLLRSTGQF